jgi:hypothetical protein
MLGLLTRVIKIRLVLLIMSLFLLGCSNGSAVVIDADKPFKLEEFFQGDVKAYGVLLNFNDELTRNFTVDIKGNWDGDDGILDEYFVYNDGEKQYRQWRIKKIAEGRYEGRADDIINVAIGGVSGSTLTWRYTMALEVDGTTWNVVFDDAMYQVDGRVINYAKIKKFGITVAKVILFFEPINAAVSTGN